MSDSPYSGANTRRNTYAFLIGKIPTALMTASILALSARYLNASEFGRYVVAMATLEIMLGLSTFGLDWILLRFLPSYRMYGTPREMFRLIGGVAALRAIVLAVLVVAVTSLPMLFPAGIGELPLDLAQPFALLLFVEGITRVVRDNTMESLMIQSRLQVAMMAKSLLVLGTLLWFGHSGGGTARALLYAESAGAFLAATIALVFVIRTVKAARGERGDWQVPGKRAMARVAFFSYTSSIFEFLFSPSFLILIMGNFQPAAQVAGVGFVLRLTELIRAYLPGMLVAGVLRASMIGAYARNRDFDELRRWASFLFKISLLTLLPAIGIVAIYGRTLLDLASSGRYGDYHHVFIMLTVWLIFRLHRLVLGVVFNAIDLMHAWARACMYSLLIVPVLLVIGPERMGIWFVGAALLSTEITMNLFALIALARDGRRWDVGWSWLGRSFCAIAVAAGLAIFLPREGWGWLGAGCLLICAIYCVTSVLFRVFDRADQALVNQSLGRRLFRNA